VEEKKASAPPSLKGSAKECQFSVFHLPPKHLPTTRNKPQVIAKKRQSLLFTVFAPLKHYFVAAAFM
jgi:hypothetical protein